MWFTNKQNEGVVYHEYFKLLPDVALTLILTGMECSIDEWATDVKTEITFTAMDYHTIFEAYLKCLHKFQDTKKHKLLDKICTKLYNVGHFHSWAQPIIATVTAAVSTNAFAAALKEYEDNSNTETDGKDGK
ncbi:hypothetical protein PILCRDRAFT_93083 [Piloderma croceum F 1598]|uniref:DUF6532 domain-containing protein n=1 Tax=Piloderma croceum (strain F 1598) TaxID=765440 RepID=A0A0C3ELE6_PILCF|nr:hypothetical protein PILCRDRAFT_93083 [Piloderma croceum F 1598]